MMYLEALLQEKNMAITYQGDVHFIMHFDNSPLIPCQYTLHFEGRTNTREELINKNNPPLSITQHIQNEFMAIETLDVDPIPLQLFLGASYQAFYSAYQKDKALEGGK